MHIGIEQVPYFSVKMNRFAAVVLICVVAMVCAAPELSRMSFKQNTGSRYGQTFSCSNTHIVVIDGQSVDVYSKTDGWRYIGTAPNKTFNSVSPIAISSAYAATSGESTSPAVIHVFGITENSIVFDKTLTLGALSFAFGRNIAIDETHLVTISLDLSQGTTNYYIYNVDTWVLNSTVTTNITNVLFENLSFKGGLIVGGQEGANTPLSGAGVAVIIGRTSGVWTVEAYLSEPTPITNGHYGSFVYAGSDVYIGASRSSIGFSEPDTRVYVYRRTGGTWSNVAMLRSPQGPLVKDKFGSAIAEFQNQLYIGAPRSTIGGLRAGAVFVYERSGYTLVETILRNVTRLDDFGEQICGAGDVLAINAPGYDDERGAIYVTGETSGTSGPSGSTGDASNAEAHRSLMRFLL